MPQIQGSLKLSSTLQQLQSGVLKVFTAKTPQLDPTKIVPMYSKGVLTNEKLLNDPVLAGFSQQVTSQLNNAKTLMNRLGYTDVTKAPAISVNLGSLKVVPGQLKVAEYHRGAPLADFIRQNRRGCDGRGQACGSRRQARGYCGQTGCDRAGCASDLPLPAGGSPGFSPVSWLVNEAVIIASSLDLTHTNLIIDPSVSKLTIIVETLTCGAGAQITYNDSTVWNPSPLPQTTAQAG